METWQLMAKVSKALPVALSKNQPSHRDKLKLYSFKCFTIPRHQHIIFHSVNSSQSIDLISSLNRSMESVTPSLSNLLSLVSYIDHFASPKKERERALQVEKEKWKETKWETKKKCVREESRDFDFEPDFHL